jgi:flagella basal body P-ring formation protein FlgA
MKYVILLLGLLLALLASAAQAAPSSLREAVVVTGDRVKLGDVFTNVGDLADKEIARSPEPGKRLTLDAQWLYRVARYFSVDWQPFSTKDRAVVVRESQVIGEEELGDHVLQALLDKGAEPDMRVAFSARGLRLYVDAATPATVSVDYASYDPRSGRFSAVISAPADDPTAQKVPVTGRLYRTVEVPVLARNMGTDEVIRQDDIKWIRMANDQIRRDVIVNVESVVGMAAKRQLRADQPLRAMDLRRPLMVEKNTPVTLVLNASGLTLTLKGLALQDGAEGDTVRVTNTQSKTVIEGTVTGAGVVAVRSIPRLTALVN